jgi:hypothetical protein
MIFTQVDDSIQLRKQHQKKKYSRSTTPTTKSRFNFTGGFAGKVPPVDTEEVISFVRNEKVIPSYKVYYGGTRSCRQRERSWCRTPKPPHGAAHCKGGGSAGGMPW